MLREVLGAVLLTATLVAPPALGQPEPQSEPPEESGESGEPGESGESGESGQAGESGEAGEPAGPLQESTEPAAPADTAIEDAAEGEEGEDDEEGGRRDEEYPVIARYSRRHISFGMGGGPIFFGSVLGDSHYYGSHVGGLANLGLGDYVDLRGATFASPAASTRGLFLPIGVDVELRFGHTAQPYSAGFAVAVGYLFAPPVPAGADHWVPHDGLYIRPQIVPLAVQIARFEVELYAGLDLVEQRLFEKTRFGPGYVSGGIRFFFVGYESEDVTPK